MRPKVHPRYCVGAVPQVDLQLEGKRTFSQRLSSLHVVRAMRITHSSCTHKLQERGITAFPAEKIAQLCASEHCGRVAEGRK